MKRTILITGANRGLGFGLARQYQADDWHVLATCRDPEKAYDLKQLGVEPLQLDVTDEASLNSLSETLRGQAIDVLFSNAGVSALRGLAFADFTKEAVSKVFEVNLVAPILLVRTLMPNVLKSQEKLIVFMSSNQASIANTTGSQYIYRSSKAGLNMVAASMAKDLASQGVRVVAVSPGWVRTDMGGPNAPLGMMESVKGIKTVLDNLASERSGSFVKYDGSTLAW